MDIRLIAHRGYAVHAPQNSLEAFETAGRLGFWAIETDVRKTLDGVLVCCHDATVDSMFEGSGEISQMQWEQLRCLTFREEKKNGSVRRERMPLFDEYLSLCRIFGCVPFIETKTSDIPQIIAAVRRYYDDREAVISSSHMEHLRMARQESKRVFIHHIFSDETAMCELKMLRPAGLSLNYPDLDAFDHVWVTRVHDMGLKMCLRAGDTIEQVRHMIELGLDYVPTNCITPQYAQRI